MDQECNECGESKKLTKNNWQIDRSKKNGWNKKCKACWKLRYEARRLNIIKAANKRYEPFDFKARAMRQQTQRACVVSPSIFQECQIRQ